MTKVDDVYMLDINTYLDHKTLREIYSKGFSRVPIYDRTKDNIIGILMTRDLILINPEKALITLKQLSSIIVRDVIAIEGQDKLEPLLGFFKKGLTHIGIVTQIVQNEHRDPSKKVIGIVTLEDIIEEIINDEIEDEWDGYIGNQFKNQREVMKEKLVLLFTDHQAEKILNEHEIKACLEFLQRYVKPFQSNRMKRDILNVMLRKAPIIELTADEQPFSHNLD